MKVGVVGMWHLGCVTAACLANHGHQVIGFDPDEQNIAQLKQGIPPIFEPDLKDHLENAAHKKTIVYSSKREAVREAEIIWVTFDTPVDDEDIADTQSVEREVEALFPYLKNNALVIISSQLPVGTTRKLQTLCTASYPDKHITFACIPENLRLGKAISVFTKPDRFVVGVQSEEDKQKISKLLNPFTSNLIWMSIESAEMTKHAINAFLATSVVFINELASLCEHVGANAAEVERGLKSEERIGAKAYVRAGNAIAGGTLARDVNYLMNIGKTKKIETPLFSNLLVSNAHHKQWTCRKLLDIMQNIQNKTISILGLTYKAGTDTLRRSQAIELSRWLHQAGAVIVAHDPLLTSLPADLASFIQLKSSAKEAFSGSDAIVVATEWPEFQSICTDELLQHTNHPLVFDPSGFLSKNLADDQRIKYFSVGRST